tara:strand:+ start:265 stop:516 length:252 start_codon:yes stop_codon:yes gene_type:complete
MASTYPDIAYDQYEGKYEGENPEKQYWELKIKMVDQASAKSACEVYTKYNEDLKNLLKSIEEGAKDLPILKCYTIGKNLYIGT